MSLQSFIDDLNAVSTRHDTEFRPSSPLSKVISPQGLSPDAFTLLLADAVGVEESDLDQGLILPDQDTVESVYTKFLVGS